MSGAVGPTAPREQEPGPADRYFGGSLGGLDSESGALYYVGYRGVFPCSTKNRACLRRETSRVTLNTPLVLQARLAISRRYGTRRCGREKRKATWGTAILWRARQQSLVIPE
jgi:hypothetical protein